MKYYTTKMLGIREDPWFACLYNETGQDKTWPGLSPPPPERGPSPLHTGHYCTYWNRPRTVSG